MTPTKIPNSNVPRWVRYRSVGYLLNRGLSFGIGIDLFPRSAIAPGKFSLVTDILPNPAISVCDGRVDIFEDSSFDHVAVGPSLQAAPNPGRLFQELVGKLKMRGHVVIYMPEGKVHPNANFTFNEEALFKLLQESGAWRIKTNICREGDHLIIAKKIPGRRGDIEPIKPSAPKRACICRYGALGDMVMITPLIRKLHEDGYEVTMNITEYAAPILANNPYVDNIILQERDAIPNVDLGSYWDEWRGDYDKYINLSESIEGRLLKVENRKEFYTSQEWRHRSCGNINYYDWTMELGGYPEVKGIRGEMFFSREEKLDALKMRKEFGDRFVVMWSLNGSSHHKIFPLLMPVAYEWLGKHPNAIIVLTGGPDAQKYEFDHPQVIKTAGQWPLRKTLGTIGMVADAMVGPESMAMNVAACYDLPKICFLSHSSHENLCKYWVNDFCLEPDTTTAPCYPCHQLHYSLESCPIGAIKDSTSGEVLASGPRCAMGAISPERVIARLDEVYLKFSKSAQKEMVGV